jgi:hypothetical protein
LFSFATSAHPWTHFFLGQLIIATMNGLDDIMKSMSESNIPQVERKLCLNESTLQSTDVVTDELKYTQETEDNIESVIERYKLIMNDLADTTINERINGRLSRIKYSKFIEYYLENAALSKYSIETELSRMDVEVTHNGITTTSKSMIQDIFWETKLHDGWRFSNQSIYADVLKNLQSYFDGSNLNFCAMASTSQFCLNLDDQFFSAVGMFDIVLESHSIEAHRLKIATVTGNIEVSLQHKTLRQWLDVPNIKMVFDTDLREAAITLLASEDSHLDTTLEFSEPKQIDVIVDAVSDTAQALPEKINSMLTDFSIEGAVGFFGKLIGAEGGGDSSAFGDLSNTLRESTDLPVHSYLSSEHVSSSSSASNVISSSRSGANPSESIPAAMSAAPCCEQELEGGEEWDDWD